METFEIQGTSRFRMRLNCFFDDFRPTSMKRSNRDWPSDYEPPDTGKFVFGHAGSFSSVRENAIANRVATFLCKQRVVSPRNSLYMTQILGHVSHKTSSSGLCAAALNEAPTGASLEADLGLGPAESCCLCSLSDVHPTSPRVHATGPNAVELASREYVESGTLKKSAQQEKTAGTRLFMDITTLYVRSLQSDRRNRRKSRRKANTAERRIKTATAYSRE